MQGLQPKPCSFLLSVYLHVLTLPLLEISSLYHSTRLYRPALVLTVNISGVSHQGHRGLLRTSRRTN